MTNAITKTAVQRNLDVVFCNRAIEWKEKLEGDFIELGGMLKRIRDEELYLGQWESFDEYCLELKGMTKDSAQKLINIYEVFAVQYKIAPAQIAKAGGWSLVAETLPYIKTKKDALYWLHEATHSHRTDLRRTIKEKKTGKPMAKCKHSQFVVYRTCMSGCGLREKITDTRV